MSGLLPWQAADWAQLRAQFDRLPHAILLTGATGTGKEHFAQYLVQALLCEAPSADHTPCGRCEGCRWLAHGTHPDFRHLTPLVEEVEGKAAVRKLEVIKIDAVRAVIEFAFLSSHRAGRRVVLVEPAEAMNLNAANALLKVLEEPPEGVVFVLITHRLQQLLPTLRSRCRIVPLAPPSTEAALAWLATQGETEARAELAHAGGAPFALTPIALRPLRQQYVATLLQPSMTAVLDTSAAVDTAKLALAQPVDWLQRWLHDLTAVRMGAAARFFPEQHAALAALAARLDLSKVAAFHDQLNQLARFGHHTLSVRMQVEHLLLAYQKLFVAGR